MEPRSYNQLLAVILFLAMNSPGAEPDGDVSPAANDWPLCPAPLPIPERPKVDADLAAGDIHISADEANLEEAGISMLHGNAEITRDRQQVSADTITYNQGSETADLKGNIEYWDDALYFSSEIAHLEFGTDTGQFENARYVLRDNRARGQASKVRHVYPSLTQLNSVDYSTCDPEDNFWKFSASEINLNHDKNWGDARNVVLRIKDVPVLYTPYISFPLSKERKTGFVFPYFGNTDRNGFEIRTPFYWNIAPEMDATLTPRVLSDNGLMMMGNFRYLILDGKGELNAEYLPSDNNYDDRDRSLIGFTHKQSFADDTGNLLLKYNRVSDKQYFEDFGTSIVQTSTRFLERTADAAYRGSWWDARARVQDYQTVDSSIPAASRPYKRLPQVQLNAYSPYRNRELNLNLSTEFSYFDRGDNAALTTDVIGARFDLFPSISYPMYTASTYLEPKAGFRYTQYELQDTGALFDTSPSRVLPMFSLDSGVFFERETTLFNKSFLQTLEPRLFYLYIPFEDQSDLPVFDTVLYDFSFDSLFREDRFTGADRMGDANQVTLAVTSRLVNQSSGKEAGYISLGQIYYLHDPEVILPGETDIDKDISPFVTEIGTSIIENWRLRGTLQWDPNDNEIEKLVAFAQYNPAFNKVINMGYRRNFTDSISSIGTTKVTEIEQTELSFMWPVTHEWNVVGRWYYDLPENRTLDVFGGIEYESCCWAFRVVARRFITNVDTDYNTGIFFQFELKGLAGIGQNTADYLRENIPGYQSEF